jgi:hypothetical protein
MHDEEDFTEDRYRELIRRARRHYRFEPFGTSCAEPHVLWRHDLDHSVHRALALARIEAEEGVAATYFVLLRSEYYNPLERAISDRLHEIASLGHRIGLHFDASFWELRDDEQLADRLAFERRLLEDLTGSEVGAFSFHVPEVGGALRFDDDVIAGMVNAYGRTLRERYPYVSDSNGYWRFRRLHDVIAAHEEPRLQVLTHPEWWVPAPMSPSARIDRAIHGRARSVRAEYDALLASLGRVNVGAGE